jgi:predicted glycoside hydrolase/deacetylase ChbG (UPF0249 family)
MKKHIVLCADDYGQGPAISQGIIALVKQCRLSAVSCMVTAPYWREHASWLKPFQAQADIGLHFNLTENKTSLSKLMLQSVLRQLSHQAIVTELHTQIDTFIDAMGALPDFIDGHQHVHQFPMIRDALIAVYRQRFPTKKPYIRLIKENIRPTDLFRGIKKLVVQVMGAKALQTLLSQHHIPHNLSFSGMYAFKHAKAYQTLFPLFLSAISDRGLIMCHPGLASTSASDLIAASRAWEYEYFSSDQFLADCHAHNTIVTRFIAN